MNIKIINDSRCIQKNIKVNVNKNTKSQGVHQKNLQ